jgi:hypothetical protein
MERSKGLNAGFDKFGIDCDLFIFGLGITGEDSTIFFIWARFKVAATAEEAGAEDAENLTKAKTENNTR